jgi:hypothetical protein
MPLAPQPLPTASVLAQSVWQRMLIRGLQTPRWARTRGTWALSAGFAAGALHLLSLLILFGPSDALYQIVTPNLETLIFTCIGTLIGTLTFSVPLWSSAGFYFAFFKPRRLTAVIWCMSFHVLAHLGVIALFETSPQALLCTIHVPLLVAGLWGLWLPGTDEDVHR